MRKGEDEPEIFWDNVSSNEVDFTELVRAIPTFVVPMYPDMVEALEKMRGGLDLDADEAGTGEGVGGTEVGGVEDDVVAFAVAEGFGDAEAVAGGGEGEGEFRDLAAAFGGEFALEGGERAARGRGLGGTRVASAGSALAFGQVEFSGQFSVLSSQFSVLSSQFSGKEGPEIEKAQARELAPIFTFYIYYSNLHRVIGT